jgi:hypothetical protein
VLKEPPQSLPAPKGIEHCPYVGCSQDFRYQLQDPGMTGNGRRGWSNGSKASKS